MGHGVWPGQPKWAVATAPREATRGNANRGETHPPAVHADARHYTEPAADSGLHAPFFVALRTFFPGPTFEDTTRAV